MIHIEASFVDHVWPKDLHVAVREFHVNDVLLSVCVFLPIGIPCFAVELMQPPNNELFGHVQTKRLSVVPIRPRLVTQVSQFLGYAV